MAPIWCSLGIFTVSAQFGCNYDCNKRLGQIKVCIGFGEDERMSKLLGKNRMAASGGIKDQDRELVLLGEFALRVDVSMDYSTNMSSI